MSYSIVVIGAGGHAAVVADALLSSGKRVLGYTDRDATRVPAILLGFPVLGTDAILSKYTKEDVRLANGLGDVRDDAGRLARQNMHSFFTNAGWSFESVRHPTAIISPSARVSGSAQVMAGAIVQAGADIGDGCIINSGAIVEHDCRIGDWTHVAPGAVVCGGVSVGPESHIGAAAVVRQSVHLGQRTYIGAGAVVIRDYYDGGILVGNPAMARKERA